MPDSVDRILTPESPNLRVLVRPLPDSDSQVNMTGALDRRASMATPALTSTDHSSSGCRCGCKGRAHAISDSPAVTLQQLLDAPSTFARQWNQPNGIGGVDILAGPGQSLSSQPRSGDILIRIIDGGSAHAEVIASPGLLHSEDLTDGGFRSDSESAEGFLHVTKGPLSQDSSERYARGVTDHTGRLLEDLLLLRLAAQPSTTVVQPPTVVKVEQPGVSSGGSVTSGDDQNAGAAVGEAGENIEAGEDLTEDLSYAWREETAEGLRKKLKVLSFLPHFVEAGGKDVALTPKASDPGFYDGPDKYKSAPQLQDCLDAVMAKNKGKLDHIRGALVDLTKDPSQPEFAGWKHTSQVFAASVPKTAAMLAAFQLRHDLNVALKKKGAASVPDLFSVVRDDWAATQVDPGGKATPFTSHVSLRGKIVLWDGDTKTLTDPKSPNLEHIFKMPPTGLPASIEFTSTGETKDQLQKVIDDFASKDKKMHADAAQALKALGFVERLRIMGGGFVPASNFITSTVVQDIGYAYIASTLLQAGLYDPARGGGLWLGADYFGTNWIAAPAGGARQSATAGSLAALMTLLARNVLVDPTSSLEFQGLLQKEPNPTHPTIVSFFKNGLKTLPDEGSLVKVLSKVGVHEGDDDCAFIEREVGTGANHKTLRYVAIGLRANKSAELQALILELDKCILRNNGLTAAQGGHASEDVEVWEQEDASGWTVETDLTDSAPEDVGVIGADDRVRITPTTDTPWRWMCHIALEDLHGKSEGHGSGVLISDRHVLTAAHVVFDIAHDRQLHFAQVRPGLDYTNEPFSSSTVARVRVCPKFDPTDDRNQEWDYALITLDKALGRTKFKSIQGKELRFWGSADFGGKFTIGPGEPKVLVAADALTAGYRGSKAYGTELWLAKGKIHSLGTRQWPNSMYTDVTTTQGQSGSPMWIKEGDLFRMVGVVVDAGTNANIVRRITPGMIAELRNWIAEDNEIPWMQVPGEAIGLDEAGFGSIFEDAESWNIQEDEVACNYIDAANLSWPGATTQQLDLMRRVYQRQVASACQSRAFVGDLPDSVLAEVEAGVRLRAPAATNCKFLLTAARTANPGSTIEVVSGYRSAQRQLVNWNHNFPRYFSQTQSDRAAADGGEFGDAAAGLLARYVSHWLAAPGFSLHNDGRAVDFRVVQDGTSMGVDGSAQNRSNWRSSGFFQWMLANAAQYRFFQNTSIDEPWHWEFRDTPAATQSIETVGFEPDTNELRESFVSEAEIPAELTIAKGRLELTNTPLLASHRGTQPDLILRWNDMTDPGGVDIVFHLHGYSSDHERMSLRRKEAYSGLDFSNPDNPSDPHPGRGAPTLCILPRGSYTGDAPGVNPEQYTFPALGTPARIRELVTYSLAQFQSATGATTDIFPRRFILTAHSGGGAALMQLLRNNTSDQLPIDEIEIFDALYGPAQANLIEPLVSWINRRITSEIQAWRPGKSRADSGICILHGGGTERQSLAIRTAIRTAIAAAPADAQRVLSAAYRVHRTAVVHGQIPRRFGWRLLADMTQAFPESGGAVESDESFPAEGAAQPAKPGRPPAASPRIGGPQPAQNAPAAGNVTLPLDVSLSAQARVYEATDAWSPTGTPQRFPFKITRLPGGEWSTVPLQINVASGHRWILEIWVSIGSSSQAFFWRCDTRGSSGIKRLDPLGSQPDRMPGSPIVPSPTGDSPIFGPLTGTQSFTSTQGMIQVSGQVAGASSAIQGQLGVNLPVVPQVTGQRTTPAPQYNVTFTADVVLANALPATLTIPDHYVQFANDSSTITSAETTSLLTWVQHDLGKYPHLREAIRGGLVPVLITGKASLRGHEHHADHNLVLSQHRVEAVRLVLQGTASASGGGRTQGGALGCENVKIDAEADGDFHDPAPQNIDQDRLVQISIDAAAAATAVQRLSDTAAP